MHLRQTVSMQGATDLRPLSSVQAGPRLQDLLLVELLVEPSELLPQPSNPILHERRERDECSNLSSDWKGCGLLAHPAPAHNRRQALQPISARRKYLAQPKAATGSAPRASAEGPPQPRPDPTGPNLRRPARARAGGLDRQANAPASARHCPCLAWTRVQILRLNQLARMKQHNIENHG